jgi:uncharacterized membrane protein (DUF4010 family)
MSILELPFTILLAFVLGGVVGLEREINERKNLKAEPGKKPMAILGLRTFSLISGLGAVCGLLYADFPILTAVVSGGFTFLLIAYYFIESKLTKDIGITTELAIIFTFLIGFILAVDLLPVQLIIAITVVLVLLMSRKEKIKNIVEDISVNEINALVSFAILAFVILPFLPNETYSLSDFEGVSGFMQKMEWDIEGLADLELFNPFKLWLIVVLITGVELLGYVLERVWGAKRGWLAASLVGGFVSSTATTISIAQKSKGSKNVNLLLAGAVFATLVSFVPVVFLLITLNPELFIVFLPVLLAMSAAAFGAGYYFLYANKGAGGGVTKDGQDARAHRIFDLSAALKFMGLFLVINIASKVALEFFGEAGFLVTTALGALAGLDAVVINTAQLAGERIDMGLALWALVLANGVNLFAKSFYSFLQGSREFAVRFLVSMVVIVGASVVGAVVF